MLTSILNPNNREGSKEMVLQKLESAFTKLYGTTRKEKRTFFEISGFKMKTFLKNNSDKFDLRTDKRQVICYVSCIDVTDRCESVFDTSSLPICPQANVKSGSIISACSFDRQDVDSLSVESVDSDWTVVTHKRHQQNLRTKPEQRLHLSNSQTSSYVYRAVC